MKLLKRDSNTREATTLLDLKGHRILIELEDGTRFDLIEYVMDGRECLMVRVHHDVLGIVPSAANAVYLQQRKW